MVRIMNMAKPRDLHAALDLTSAVCFLVLSYTLHKLVDLRAHILDSSSVLWYAVPKKNAPLPRL